MQVWLVTAGERCVSSRATTSTGTPRRISPDDHPYRARWHVSSLLHAADRAGADQGSDRRNAAVSVPVAWRPSPVRAGRRARAPGRRGRGQMPGSAGERWCRAGPGQRMWRVTGGVYRQVPLPDRHTECHRRRLFRQADGVGGSVSLRRQPICGDGGPAGIAARMLAVSPAGMAAVLALPRGITVATASPAGAWPRDGSTGGRLMTEAWSRGGPGGPGCRSRRVSLAGRGAWPPVPGFAGPQARHT